ncbi:RING-type [Hexamita inflata]|uniref:RING-type n=1 Tax=Hexamita inflata TaxID=28002 RepID=A0AA86PKW3_9EUKA|nr:RING-type [Hexamita inflata]
MLSAQQIQQKLKVTNEQLISLQNQVANNLYAVNYNKDMSEKLLFQVELNNTFQKYTTKNLLPINDLQFVAKLPQPIIPSKLVEPFKQYKCQNCQSYMTQAILSSCGCICCLQCVEQSEKCPKCKKEVTNYYERPDMCHPIKQLQFKCACGFKAQYSEIIVHCRTCFEAKDVVVLIKKYIQKQNDQSQKISYIDNLIEQTLHNLQYNQGQVLNPLFNKIQLAYKPQFGTTTLQTELNILRNTVELNQAESKNKIEEISLELTQTTDKLKQEFELRKQFESECESLKANSEYIQNQALEYFQQIQQLKFENEEMTKFVQEKTENGVEEIKNQLQTAQIQNLELRQQIEEKNSEILTLKNNNNQVKEDKDEPKNEELEMMVKECKQAKKELQKQIEALAAENKLLQNEVTSTAQIITQTKDTELQNLRKDYEQTKIELEKQIKTLTQEKTEKEQLIGNNEIIQNQKLEEVRNELQTQIETQYALIKEQTEQQQKDQITINKFEEQQKLVNIKSNDIETLQLQISQLKEINETIQTKNQMNIDEVEQLKNQISNRVQSNTETQDQNSKQQLEKVTELQKQINAKNTELETIKEELINKSAEIKELNQQNVQLQNKLIVETGRRQEMQQEINIYVTQVKTGTAQNQTVTAQNMTLQQKCTELQQQLQESNEQIQKLNNQKQETQLLEAKIAELTAFIETKESEMLITNQHLEEVIAQSEKLQNGKQMLQSRIIELQSEVVKLNVLLQQKDAECIKCQNELEEARKLSEEQKLLDQSPESDNEQYLVTIQILQTKLENLQKEFDTELNLYLIEQEKQQHIQNQLSQALIIIQTNNEEQQILRNEFEQTKFDLQKQINELTQEKQIIENNEKTLKLQHAKNELQKQIDTQKAIIQEQTEKIQSIESQLSQEINKNQKCEEIKTEQQKNVEAQYTEIRTLKQQISQLTETIKILQTKNVDQQNNLGEIESQISEQNTHTQNPYQESFKLELEATIIELQKQIDAKKKETESFQEQIRNTIIKYQEFKYQNAQLQKDLATATDKYEELQQQISSTDLQVQIGKDQNQALQQKCTELQQQLYESNQQIQKLNNQKQETQLLEAKIAELTAFIETKESEMLITNQHLEEVIAQSEKYQNNEQMQQSKIIELQNQLDCIAQQLSSLQTENEELKQKADRQINSSLYEQINQVNNLLIDKEDQLANKLKQFESLNTKLQEVTLKLDLVSQPSPKSQVFNIDQQKYQEILVELQDLLNESQIQLREKEMQLQKAQETDDKKDEIINELETMCAELISEVKKHELIDGQNLICSQILNSRANDKTEQYVKSLQMVLQFCKQVKDQIHNVKDMMIQPIVSTPINRLGNNSTDKINFLQKSQLTPNIELSDKRSEEDNLSASKLHIDHIDETDPEILQIQLNERNHMILQLQSQIDVLTEDNQKLLGQRQKLNMNTETSQNEENLKQQITDLSQQLENIQRQYQDLQKNSEQNQVEHQKTIQSLLKEINEQNTRNTNLEQSITDLQSKHATKEQPANEKLAEQQSTITFLQNDISVLKSYNNVLNVRLTELQSQSQKSAQQDSDTLQAQITSLQAKVQELNLQLEYANQLIADYKQKQTEHQYELALSLEKYSDLESLFAQQLDHNMTLFLQKEEDLQLQVQKNQDLEKELRKTQLKTNQLVQYLQEFERENTELRRILKDALQKMTMMERKK